MKRQNMKDSIPREIAFNGVRLTFDSNKSFDDVVSSLLADVGDKPVLLNEVAANSYDTKWGGFVINGDFFTRLVYAGV